MQFCEGQSLEPYSHTAKMATTATRGSSCFWALAGPCWARWRNMPCHPRRHLALEKLVQRFEFHFSFPSPHVQHQHCAEYQPPIFLSWFVQLTKQCFPKVWPQFCPYLSRAVYMFYISGWAWSSQLTFIFLRGVGMPPRFGGYSNNKPPIFDGWNPTHKSGDEWGMVYGIAIPTLPFILPCLTVKAEDHFRDSQRSWPQSSVLQWCVVHPPPGLKGETQRLQRLVMMFSNQKLSPQPRLAEENFQLIGIFSWLGKSYIPDQDWFHPSCWVIF